MTSNDILNYLLSEAKDPLEKLVDKSSDLAEEDLDDTDTKKKKGKKSNKKDDQEETEDSNAESIDQEDDKEDLKSDEDDVEEEPVDEEEEEETPEETPIPDEEPESPSDTDENVQNPPMVSSQENPQGDSSQLDNMASSPNEDDEVNDEEVPQNDTNRRIFINEKLLDIQASYKNLRDFILQLIIKFSSEVKLEKLLKGLLDKIEFDEKHLSDFLESDDIITLEFDKVYAIYKIYINDLKKMNTILTVLFKDINKYTESDTKK